MSRLALLSIAVLGAFLVGGWAPAPGLAYRPLLSTAFLQTVESQNPAPPPEGQLEDPCGLAIAPDGSIYVADYYHRAVDLFSSSGEYTAQIALPGGPMTGFGSNELDGVCGLAIDPSGNLYANEWHQAAVRLQPTEFWLDSGNSTGVAVDGAGDVFVDDRTYVAEYAAPVQGGDEPAAKIGEGALSDAYGLAVSGDGQRVFVADAGAGTVKVFEPSGDPTTAVATIAPPEGFTSLIDAALAIDPTLEPALPEHLLVVDNIQPGYEHPEAAVDEFEAPGVGHPGSYAFVGQVRGPAAAPIVHGQPSGLAVDAVGDLFVTDGNSEGGNVFKFGPDPPGEAPAAGGLASAVSTSVTAAPSSSPAGSPIAAPVRATKRRGIASSVIQRGKVRVSVGAVIAPRRLPRHGAAPIRFSLSTKIASVDGSVPPQLRGISVAINRHGHLDPIGLPVCNLGAIQPSTTADALTACRRSLIGEGRFNARVLIAQQAPFPSSGKVLAFNGRWHGRPAILAHVFGSQPVPTSYTLPFTIGTAGHGTYGTVLSASLPHFTSKWGYVTGISLELGRSFRYHGARHSYLTAGCPAPPGFRTAAFALSRVRLVFAGRAPTTQTLASSCTAR